MGGVIPLLLLYAFFLAGMVTNLPFLLVTKIYESSCDIQHCSLIYIKLLFYRIDIDIFVDCNWVDTRWQ